MADLRGRVAAERRCLVARGADVRAVLQDVVTSDVGAAREDRAGYAALLTPQGKYLADFLMVETAEGLVIDAAADQAEALRKRLSMYCLRRDATIETADGIAVGQVWDGEGGPDPSPPQAPAAVVVPDPRDRRLGWRIYGADPAAALAAMGAAETGRAEWDALRVALAIPESGIELEQGETFILEAGLDRLGGVDFRKGCYVGQEVTARMRHKTELRKRLLRVAVEGAAEPGTPIASPDGKPAGTLYTQAGGEALAHLRLDRAQAGEDGLLPAALTVGEARITALLGITERA